MTMRELVRFLVFLQIFSSAHHGLLDDPVQFPKSRQTGLTNILGIIRNVCDHAHRFFPPHEAHVMLDHFLPLLDGTDISTVLAAQFFLNHLIPSYYSQNLLPLSFSLWQSFNSALFTSSWIEHCASLSEIHLNPAVSGPQHYEHYRCLADLNKPNPSLPAEDLHLDATYPGVLRDVGIYTEDQWEWIASECLRSMHIPVGSSNKTSQGFLSLAGTGDSDAIVPGGEMPLIKSKDRIRGLATIFVYSMMEDGLTMPPSTMMTPQPSAPATPRPSTRSYLGGSKALDSLSKFIQATESFFHPSNSGMWTPSLTRFIDFLASEFLRRQAVSNSFLIVILLPHD